ncbi:hypothetical protein [Tumebacillus flagellatus]|uniref:Uncharacterized protein n=1 Tax=Tumebacillus flagellatus TaxID=1157490 RepID=A0A074LVL7_9BACL|nr:hypothetical protein [Tumebacillus flagellatus]KEO85059.1 hypothetical protein EL26_00400 [Tumebacillus flagellatus]
MKKTNTAYFIWLNVGLTVASVFVSLELIMNMAPTLYTELFILGIFIIPVVFGIVASLAVFASRLLFVSQKLWHSLPTVAITFFLGFVSLFIVPDQIRFQHNQNVFGAHDSILGYHVDAPGIDGDFYDKIPEGFSIDDIQDIQVTSERGKKYWVRFNKSRFLLGDKQYLSYYDWMKNKFSSMKTVDDLANDLTAFEHLAKKPNGTVEWYLEKDYIVFNTRDNVHYKVFLKPDGDQVAIDHVDVQ